MADHGPPVPWYFISTARPLVTVTAVRNRGAERAQEADRAAERD